MIKACVLCGVCISVFLTPVQAKEEVVQGVVQVQDDTGKPLEGAAFQLISYGEPPVSYTHLDVYKRQGFRGDADSGYHTRQYRRGGAGLWDFNRYQFHVLYPFDESYEVSDAAAAIG